MKYDLLVIGNSREGIERAISVARTGRSAAIIQTPNPATSLDVLQAAVRNLSEQGPITLDSWKAEVARLSTCQKLTEDVELKRAGVVQIVGAARFVSATEVEAIDDSESQVISANEIMIACGTRSRTSSCLSTDGRFVFDIESLLELDEMPQTMVVIGAGLTGTSAAMMLTALGIYVDVVDEHASLLDVCSSPQHSFNSTQSLNIAFRMNDEAIGIQRQLDLRVAVRLKSGRTITADAVLVCIGREGNTDDLNLNAAGVGIDENGRLWCDANGQTWTSSVTAVGDVIGFPRQMNRTVAFAL